MTRLILSFFVLSVVVGCAGRETVKPSLPLPAQSAAEELVEKYVIDWNLVKSVDDVVQVLKNTWPNWGLAVKADSVKGMESLKAVRHLLKSSAELEKAQAEKQKAAAPKEEKKK